uniref:Uncharacterized protein n=1 Tax=Molossus molossus TaxID=27622 RepID=A0A7J8IYY6_MOLMO|nr:hypothetical protein HJG59_010246 [Molossus molossus]
MCTHRGERTPGRPHTRAHAHPGTSTPGRTHTRVSPTPGSPHSRAPPHQGVPHTRAHPHQGAPTPGHTHTRAHAHQGVPHSRAPPQQGVPTLGHTHTGAHPVLEDGWRPKPAVNFHPRVSTGGDPRPRLEIGCGGTRVLMPSPELPSCWVCAQGAKRGDTGTAEWLCPYRPPRALTARNCTM